MKAESHDIVRKSAQVVAKAAEQNGAVVISGGTDAGVMAAIGQARAQGNYHFPLVGVVVENLVIGFDSIQKDTAPSGTSPYSFFIGPWQRMGGRVRVDCTPGYNSRRGRAICYRVE